MIITSHLKPENSAPDGRIAHLGTSVAAQCGLSRKGIARTSVARFFKHSFLPLSNSEPRAKPAPSPAMRGPPIGEKFKENLKLKFDW